MIHWDKNMPNHWDDDEAWEELATGMGLLIQAAAMIALVIFPIAIVVALIWGFSG